MTTLALIIDTFREALARKIFWAFFFASTAILLFFMFIMHVDVVNGMVASLTIFKPARIQNSLSAVDVVRTAQSGLSGFLYSIGMGLAIFASAGLISAVFEPGRVELLLSKPVQRWQILMGRYLGNLLIVGFNLFYLVTGFWIIFGVKVGVWRPYLLLASVITLFMFGVVLTFILLTAVLWENAAVSILATFALVIICLILGARPMLERLLSSETSRNIVSGLYYVLPKIPDTGNILMKIIMGTHIDSWMPIWSSAIFGAVVLGTGLWVFSRRNF
jgi:ABC-type transport system involved in multi-copper enzyme maturation permease subunit